MQTKNYLVEVKNKNKFDNISRHSFRIDKVTEDYKEGFVQALKNLYGDELIIIMEIK